MAIAQIGPVTSAVEAEGQILRAGYVGGLIGIGAGLLDLLLRYG